MKKLLSLLFVCVFLLTGCTQPVTPLPDNSTPPSVDNSVSALDWLASQNLVTYPIEGEWYTINQDEDGKAYLEFTEKFKEAEKPFYHHGSWVSFNSLDELYKKYSTCQFSFEEFGKHNFQDRHNEERFPMPDFNRLLTMTGPEGIDVVCATWEEEHGIQLDYTILNWHDRYDLPMIEFTYKELGTEWITQEIEKREEYLGNLSILSTEEERNAIRYDAFMHYLPYEPGNKNFFLSYTLATEEKTLYILEKYRDHIDDNDGYFKKDTSSSTVPNEIEILGIDRGVGFKIRIYLTTRRWAEGLFGDYFYVDKRPSEDWLLSFGIEPFVPESAADTAV